MLFLLFFQKKIPRNIFLVFLSFFILLSLISIVHNYYIYDNFVGGFHSQNYFEIIFNDSHSSLGAMHGQNTDHRILAFEEIFFGRDHGLFILSPILLLSSLGVGTLYRNNKPLLLSLILIMSSIISIYLLLLPTIPLIGMGGVVFRYFLPILPLFSIPFAIAMQQFGKTLPYKIIFGILLGISSYICVILATISENASSNHMLTKLEVIQTAYLGLSNIFPALGPTTYGKKSMTFHQPLTELNILFLVVIVSLIIFAIIMSFRYKLEKKSL